MVSFKAASFVKTPGARLFCAMGRWQWCGLSLQVATVVVVVSTLIAPGSLVLAQGVEEGAASDDPTAESVLEEDEATGERATRSEGGEDGVTTDVAESDAFEVLDAISDETDVLDEGENDISQATTIDDLSIPIDQLELLLRPLTLDQLEVEAAAWQRRLQGKVTQISLQEIAIKRENQAIQEEEAAVDFLEKTSAQLQKAEDRLARFDRGTPQFTKALKARAQAEIEQRQAERDAQRAIARVKSLKEDKAVQNALSLVQTVERIADAKRVLEIAVLGRQQMSDFSSKYLPLGRKLSQFELAIQAAERMGKELETAIPGTPSHGEKSKTLLLEIENMSKLEKTLLESQLLPKSVQSEIEAEFGLPEAETTTGFGPDTGSEDADLDGLDVDGLNEDIRIDRIVEGLAEQEAFKQQLIKLVTKLQLEQTEIIERFGVVLDALEDKGGDPASYRLYASAVGGLEFDLTDTEGLGVRLKSWLTSENGGIRLGLNIASLFGILIASFVISRIAGKATNRVLSHMGKTSTLFREFLVMVVQRGSLVVGGLLAIASLGVNLGPLVALIGGASFILAFALQSNLGNFASGLMLLINKPFDVGDEVKISGYNAFVDSISLANTKLKDLNGNMVFLPNNSVWENEIINFSHSENRQIALPVHVEFEHEISKIRHLWFDLVSQHPKVLETPPPSINLRNELYGYYNQNIIVILKAWCPTDVYWEVHAEILQRLQTRFREVDIALAEPHESISVD